MGMVISCWGMFSSSSFEIRIIDLLSLFLPFDFNRCSVLTSPCFDKKAMSIRDDEKGETLAVGDAAFFQYLCKLLHVEWGNGYLVSPARNIICLSFDFVFVDCILSSFCTKVFFFFFFSQAKKFTNSLSTQQKTRWIEIMARVLQLSW
jgi:hypothetical protein